MQFDSLLNLAWLLAGLIALLYTARATFCNDTPRRGPRWLLLVGVALIVAALFPYISATDDVLRIDNFHSHHAQSHRSGPQQPLSSQHQQNQKSKRPKVDNLMRLYEAIETAVVHHAAGLVLTFFFVAFVPALTVECITRITPQLAGRSPPALAAA